MRASIIQKATIKSSAAASRKQNPAAHLAFISGPFDADAAYFKAHYEPPIKAAIAKGHYFVIGSSPGIDTYALEYLRKSGVPPRCIRLYINISDETKLKPLFRSFEEAGGYVAAIKGGLAERDEAMTQGSHYDILRCRTEEDYHVRHGENPPQRDNRTPENVLRRKSGVGLVFPSSGASTNTKE